MIPELAGHLWQSTLFAGAVWLASLALRTNRAQVRFWVWFSASAKFLVPFSWLIGIGALLPHRTAVPAVRAEWVSALQEFSQPLTIPPVAARDGALGGAASYGYLAAAALALWACGFAVVTICWLRRWRRVHTLRQSARLVRVPTGLEIPVPVMSVTDLVEPGVFGVLRPVLLLPEGIVERLTQTQLDAILMHELCHVRRRDNLTASIHMAVQAVFWFHPLTWWIGARLVEERERACDEEVLRLGCKPAVYAESILTVCKLYLSSPLACVSGVTGSDLKRRVEAIMRNRRVAALSCGKKLALGAAAATALVAPIVVGMLHAPVIRAQNSSDWQVRAGGKMAFEVASVKLDKGEFVPPAFPLDASDAYRPVGGHFRADFPLWNYIHFAYKITPAEEQRREMLAHLPGWVTTDRYSIDARAPGNPTKDQMRLMMQSLLAERFHLAIHFESKEVPVFALTLVRPGKMGPKLRLHADGPGCDVHADSMTERGFPEVFPPVCETYGALRAHGTMLLGSRNTTLDLMAGALAGPAGGRPIVDKTGLRERVDFRLEWTPDPEGAAPPSPDGQPPDSPGPTFQQALRDQLGLKLEAARGPIQILLIDKVERPSDN